jgi:protein-S-isoprenylcysteine O-methyltransferase Ste14
MAQPIHAQLACAVRRVRIPMLGDLLLSALFLALARAGLQAWGRSGDIAPLLLAGQELLIAGLALCRRRVTRSQPARQPIGRAAALAWSGTFLPLLLRPAALAAAALDVRVGLALQLIGGILALAATLSLGRSFGIVAANRGIRVAGLYHVVRHPIYATYLLIFSGFILAHPSPVNAAVLVIWTVVQACRALAEERVLAEDSAYRDYQTRVRYRLLPGIW